MKRHIIYILLLLIGIFSCKTEYLYDGYSQSKNGLIYKLIALGEDTIHPKISDFITVSISYSLMNDSVFFSNKKKIQITTPNYPNCIDECFIFMNKGDSTSFILDASLFFEKTLGLSVPSFIDSSNLFKVNIRLIDIQRFEDYQKQKEEFLSWIEDFGKYEKVFLKNYLKEQNLDTIKTINGLYKLTLRPGTGKSPQKGDTLTINYEGKFLNGLFFDSTKKRNLAFEFIFGTEWQVIKGMEKAVAMMKEGEKALFIMPSELAFGATGSSSGIVPPYTSVIFEVELKKLAKGDTSVVKTITIDTTELLIKTQNLN